MQNNGTLLPDVREISKIIDAIRDYAVTSVRACHEEHLTDFYHAPSLSSWDAWMWFALVKDWKLSDFLVSGTDKAETLVKSLQSCLQWYGQGEIDDVRTRLKIKSMMN